MKSEHKNLIHDKMVRMGQMEKLTRGANRAKCQGGGRMGQIVRGGKGIKNVHITLFAPLL